MEKILAHGEELPVWPCAGTTGYDTLSLVGGLFIDPAGDVPLTDEYVRFTGGKQSFADVERDAKRDIADGTFAAELARLTRLFDRAAASGRLFGLLLDGVWMHVGTPEAVTAAEAALAATA